ncbi:N-acetylmuramoyl-L-alanine amidase [Croceitalea sp. MTPC9]|uniref:N-acetylmuramoyl-L-alanine amidase family protein n=1 Tax=unclassified Croceitalea TaxID=2632280 RepID=UPI002B3FC218|nr:N-acetylmuramoyl-L-alanine amidase [Croceitalea sp. MTPC6]GMN16025.1 N-acetylmuramoyl-L-alanine amidase [Croceitalea sp. MTPC9]
MIKNRLLPILFSALFLLFTSFIKNNTEAPQKDKFIVVLDAGHGGHDPGNLGNGYLEKDIALAIVLKVGELLDKKEDIEVIFTRDDDTFVDLFERGEIANKANANLFVSVHCDSHTSDANGAGTFVLGLHANKQNFEVAKKENSVIYLEDNYEQKYAKYDINSPESVIGLTIMQEEFLEQSIQLAKLMQDNFAKKLKRKDRKVKQAGFIVLHQTFMPSVLVETGFLTNKGEGAYLNSAKGQNEMGTAIANAILSYKDGVDANLIELDKSTPKEVIVKNDEPIKEVKDKVITPPKKEIVVKTEEKAPDVVKATKIVTKETKPQKMETVAADNVIFKVQLMASSKIIPLDGNNFKGLNTLSKEPVKNLYRYMYGNTNSYLKAKLLKSNADAKGYTTSYIVAYKNGVRIPLQEALKSVPVQ